MNLSVDLTAKRLDLLHELVQTASVIALLVNPTNQASELMARAFEDAAGSLGLSRHLFRAATPSEIDAAFAAVGKLRAGALVLGGDPVFTNQRARIVALAARYAVPASYE